MKALSVCQPWAFLLVNGFKNVENRKWATQHRGPLLIHAGVCKSSSWKKSRFAQQAALEGVYARLRALGIAPPVIPDDLEAGGIVGRVTLLDCVRRPEGELLPCIQDHIRALSSPWFEGPVGWLVSDPAPLPFVPLRGHLHLFDYDPPEEEGWGIGQM